MGIKYHGQFGIPFSKIHKDKELPYIVPIRYRVIIGVVGLKYSGKSVLTSYLVEDLGYRFYSLSRVVRSEAERLCLSPGRRTLQNLGDQLRRRYGRDYLARRIVLEMYRDIVERGESIDFIVVDGIKNVGEIEYLRRLERYYLIGVSAHVDKRHRRAVDDGSFKGDLAAFKDEVDKRDLQMRDRNGQQVGLCLKAVAREHVILNESTRDEFVLRAQEILGRMGGLR